jgi:sugar lactone lactonase YvrE
VQTLMNDQKVSGRSGTRFPRWKMSSAARGVLVACSALCGLMQPIEAQKPSIVASGQLNLTPSGGMQTGPAVVDSCGNVYVNESGNVVEVAAGTGTIKVLAANTNGYGGPNSIAIDSTKSNLYFPLASQWYSSAFSTVPITNCVPGGPSNFGTNSSYLYSYYYGTAGAIAVDGYGDVFFTVTADGNGDISEVACSTAPATACTTPPTAGATSTALTGWPNTITSLAADATGDVFFTDSSASVYELKAGYTAAPTAIGSGFSKPVGVSFDPHGNLYVADGNNSILYEIPNESGTLNAADEFEVVQNLGLVSQVAVDASEHIYVANYSDNLLEEVIGSASLPATAYGKTSAASSVNYVFNASVTPATISVNSGAGASTVFTNVGGGCAAGTTYTSGEGCSVNLTYTSSAIGLQTGTVVLAAAGGAVLNTATVSAIGQGAAATIDPGTLSALTGSFKTPEGASVDSQGNVYVADAGNNTVTEFPTGSATGTAVSTGSVTLNGPSAVAVDAAGAIYISDTGNNRLVEVPVVGGVLTPASTAAVSTTGLATALKSPGGLAFDAEGNLYVADSGNNRLLFVPNYDGALGFALAVSYGSGLSGPSAVTVDATGTVFLADTGNNAIVEFAGPLGSQAQLDVATGLNAPSAVATDASGSLYVVNKGDNSVVKYPLISGTLGTQAFVGLTIADPYGVAVDSSGNLYVTDSTNAVVDKIARVQTTLPFGDWNINATSTPLTAIVSNAGNLPLVFNTPDYVASGTSTSGFVVTADGCATAGNVVSGSSCDLTATFTPPAAEVNAQETLTLSSNADNGTPSVALMGTGETITATTLSLALTSSASGTLNVGIPVTFAAIVGTGTNTTAPGGDVTFYVNGVQAGPEVPVTSASGTFVATLTIPNGLPAGSAIIVAVYSGDDKNYSGSSASLSETVTAQTSAVALTVNSPYTNPSSANDNSANATGPSVTLVAALTLQSKIIPTGTVSFYSGTGSNATLLGIGNVVAGGGGYEATISENSLRAGTTNVVENLSTLTTYSIFAVYSGDNTYYSATSASEPLTIVAPPMTLPACATASPATCDSNTTGATFSITPTNPTITISTAPNGQGSGSTVLTINSYGGWTGVLNFTCSNLPAYAKCAPYPGDPVVTASTPTATTQPTTVQFIINTNVQPLPPTASGFYWWLSGICGLILLTTRRKLKRHGFGGVGTTLALAMLMVASIGGTTGCGSGSTFYTTPSGTSTVTVQVSAAQLVPLTTNESVEPPDSNVGSFTIALTVQ